MIKDRAAYERFRARDEAREAAALDLAASTAVAEALLTSSIMALAPRVERPRPLNLARALGIRPRAP